MACQYTGDGDLRVVELFRLVDVFQCAASCYSTSATEVLSHPPDLWFVSETFGLEDFQLTGFGEPIDNDLGEPRSNCRNYIIRYFILSYSMCVRV